MEKIANKVIAYAFMVGVIIAIILGLVATRLSSDLTAILMSILIVAGIIVGFFNIEPSEQKDYVLYVTALVIVLHFGGSALGGIQWVGKYLNSVLGALMAFILPSLVIVVLKAIYNLAKD